MPSFFDLRGTYVAQRFAIMILFDSEIPVEAPLIETQVLKVMATQEFMLPGRAQVWAHPIGDAPVQPPTVSGGLQPTGQYLPPGR